MAHFKNKEPVPKELKVEIHNPYDISVAVGEFAYNDYYIGHLINKEKDLDVTLVWDKNKPLTTKEESIIVTDNNGKELGNFVIGDIHGNVVEQYLVGLERTINDALDLDYVEERNDIER